MTTIRNLDDYSGDFFPSAKFADLSKDALVRLCQNYQRIFVGYMGMWHTVNEEKGMSPEEAWDMDSYVYERQIPVFEVPLVREALNIQGNDVVSMFKYFQFTLDGARQETFDYRYEVENNNHVRLTCHYCATLHYYERHGDDKGIELLCLPGGCEDRSFNAIAKAFNPDIKCIPVKLPPRKNKDDICCIWEFKIEE